MISDFTFPPNFFQYFNKTSLLVMQSKNQSLLEFLTDTLEYSKSRISLNLNCCLDGKTNLQNLPKGINSYCPTLLPLAFPNLKLGEVDTMESAAMKTKIIIGVCLGGAIVLSLVIILLVYIIRGLCFAKDDRKSTKSREVHAFSVMREDSNCSATFSEYGSPNYAISTQQDASPLTVTTSYGSMPKGKQKIRRNSKHQLYRQDTLGESNTDSAPHSSRTIEKFFNADDNCANMFEASVGNISAGEQLNLEILNNESEQFPLEIISTADNKLETILEHIETSFN